jgi:hypothetical protein
MSDLIFPSPGGGGGGGNTTIHRFTDSTDISLPSAQASAAVIGSSQSIDIPAEGSIRIANAVYRIDATAGSSTIRPSFGLKIAGTVYPLAAFFQGAEKPVYPDSVGAGSAANVYSNDVEFSSNNPTIAPIDYLVDVHSLPIGQQTVELVTWALYSATGGVLKGTTLQTKISLAITDCTGG